MLVCRENQGCRLGSLDRENREELDRLARHPVGPQLPRPDALERGAYRGKPAPGYPAGRLGRERKRTGPEGPAKLIREAKKLGEERTTGEASSPAPGVHPEPADPCREARAIAAWPPRAPPCCAAA